ncbi:urokinase-type plasminogen activator-like isoform X2 [Plodia interpunctella]|uniref:urokinase-type plasminogen activator-like isoform X2 n=1 Tax=Plodia interpunctella TaxID=58824 RepID=UPI002368ADC5|nr:urokinase-type plasminogen activator-like isoform X2 [Plodia interpunctella]
MMIKWPSRIFIVLSLIFLVEARKEKCEKCLPMNSCSFYGNLSKDEQLRWIDRFECPKPDKEGIGPLFGFAPTAKGDMVCCPNSIWGTNTKGDNKNDSHNAQYNAQPDHRLPNQRDITSNYNSPGEKGSNRPNDNLNGNSNDSGSNRPSDNINAPNYETHRSPQHQVRQPYSQGNWAPRPIANDWNRNNQNYGGNGNSFNRNGNSFSGNDNTYGRNDNFNRNLAQNGNTYYLGRNGNSFGGNGNSFGGNRHDLSGDRNSFVNGNNGNQFGGNGNAFGANENINSFGNGNNGNSFDGVGNQCPATSFPPTTDSGCCGREATDSDRITGGKETDLEQFPWTVLLKTTFDYGTSEASFNCGGSLISSYYVLTAGHCVVEDNARVKEVEVYLAEYDKRTFPRDCKSVLGEGRKCVENIVMRAQNVIPHPNYDNDRLYNDIALIRMQRPAPYSDYIRPICLPPINIDEPDFFNLRLAVAGWGRNGKYKSEIKQSTVVNLVPNRECREYYPHLSKSQLCAAGYSGEDTCKGDSGGPLMLQYEGKYFVSGVVSGKRADAPCGTSVPSLYTNVYQHLDWIRRNIRN